MERSRPIERLANALQECLNEATERGSHKAAATIKEELTPRLDRQDETLRLIWRQVKGSGRLPIDN